MLICKEVQVSIPSNCYSHFTQLASLPLSFWNALGKTHDLSSTSQYLVCCASTQRGHALSSQCLLKTQKTESSWHRQDTAALSAYTSLSLSPWSFFHSHLFSFHSFCPCLSLSLLSSHHPILPRLSVLVTSVLLLILCSLTLLAPFVLSIQLWPILSGYLTVHCLLLF